MSPAFESTIPLKWGWCEISVPMEFGGVCGETRAESGEPEVAGGRLECGFQCNQDARTADIAVAAEDFSRVGEGISGDFFLNGFNDVPAAGMRDEVFRIATAGREKLGDGIRGERGNGPVELVFEASILIDEANFFTVFGFVKGLES